LKKHIILTFLQLSHIPHYTTLQKFAARINGTLLERIISSFILLLTNIGKIFTGIDSTGFKITNSLSIAAMGNVIKVEAGRGNASAIVDHFFPENAEIKVGQSITGTTQQKWVNRTLLASFWIIKP